MMRMDECPLSQLPQGGSAIIKEIRLSRSFSDRLYDLGMEPGSVVVCLHIAPSGSPVAFFVKNTIIALRKSECSQITAIPYG